MQHFRTWLHALLTGRRLQAAIDRNNAAADRLDATLRETLGR